jgi:cytochrome c oxidase cbb3-type subunit III
MTEPVRDPHSGYLTTGHVWNGITELNSPVPRPVWWFMSVTHIVALACLILLPAIPLWFTYTKGLLGTDQHSAVAAAVASAVDARSDWTAKMAAMPYTAIKADPALMHIVRETGATLFGTNCAACHGKAAMGGPGFPNLTDGDWLWGNDPETIAETLRVGINSAHPDSRIAQMPAFGHDELLSKDQVALLVPYIMGLSVPGTVPDPAAVTSFAENCASCHGDNAKGLQDVGAPNLTDDIWQYGGEAASVRATLWNGRQGVMPTWEARLSDTDRKILTLYVLDLGQ